MTSPFPLRECKLCRKEGKRTKVETINSLCFKQAPFHYQSEQERKYKERISRQQDDRPKVNKIKPVSNKRAKELREYEKQKAIHFEEFPVCQFPGCCSTEVTLHHMRGRTGSYLTDPRYFKTLCWPHHQWAESNPEEAKAMGISMDRLSKAS